MPWPFRREPRDPLPDPNPDLLDAEYQVRRLEERAHRVERVLRPRHERNHWSETVDELWRGRLA